MKPALGDKAAVRKLNTGGCQIDIQLANAAVRERARARGEEQRSQSAAAQFHRGCGAQTRESLHALGVVEHQRANW
jgi:hypothetical protein